MIRSIDGKRAICVDIENKAAILEYIYRDKRHKKKWLHFANLFLNGYRNSDLYDKEDIDSKSKGVTAIKFFKGQENDRIYCKEQRTADGIYLIVTAELYEKKKSQSVDKKIIPIIHKIAKYEYEIETASDQP